MQTGGFWGIDASEREAELRRRNEEIELRQAEAVRIARDIIQTQEAKLATSPSPSRSTSRRNKVFVTLSHRASRPCVACAIEAFDIWGIFVIRTKVIF